MQYAACTFDPFDIPWILQNFLFLHTSFGGKVFLIFPIIYLPVDLKLICIIGLSDLINALIFADSCPGLHNYSLWVPVPVPVPWSVGSEISLS